MKPRNIVLTSLTSISLLALALSTLQATRETLGSVHAQNPSYGLDITSLSASNKTLNTSNGNPIAFYVSSYENGSFSAGGSIKNKTAINGLKSIAISGLQAGSSLTVSYGWSVDNDWAVTNGIIDSDHLVYTFGDECPSFFKIKSSSATTITDISLSYSCNATDEPMNYVLTFSDNGDTVSISDCKTNAVSVTIPSTYLGKPVTAIGEYAFNGCSSLTSITIPDSVTAIGEYAFTGCSSLASITIPDSLSSIGDGLFSNCSSLALISIPSPITSIGSSAFYNCSSLASIHLPDSLDSIGSSAFYGCTDLESINLPDDVASIGNGAFQGCTALASIHLPDSLDSIDAYTFDRCTSLSSISLPDGITSIGKRSFRNCSALTSVSIPSNVVSVGEEAFKGCTSLVSFTYEGTMEQWESINFGLYWLSSTQVTEIACSDGTLSV